MHATQCAPKDIHEDLEFFKSRGEGEREPVILFVGRFVGEEGDHLPDRGKRKAAEQGESCKMVLIANGPLEAELKEAAAKARIPCHFAGFPPTQEVRFWSERATVVATPSVTASNDDFEGGLPTVLLESQAMETPVVATRNSAVPEGAKEGLGGELVAERDGEYVAQKLGSFLESSPGPGVWPSRTGFREREIGSESPSARPRRYLHLSSPTSLQQSKSVDL